MPDETINLPEDVDSVLADVTEPEEIRILNEDERKVAVKIIPILVAKVNRQLEAKRGKELADTIEQLKDENNKLVERELNKIREDSKPPDLNEISQLLNQEYVEIKFPILGKEFVLRELPQAAENRFLKVIRQKLMPKLAMFTSLEWSNTGTVFNRIERVVEAFPEALGILAELTAICLNPFDHDKEITTEWVQNNISSYRMQLIVQAQMEAGKMRDFILNVFRSLPGLKTT